MAAGGAVAVVGLPLLEAMLNTHGDALAAGEPLAKRYLVWFFGNGNIPNRWTPAMTGPNWTSEQTAPLDKNPEVKKYVSILSGFNNKSPKKITHHEGMAIFSGHPFSGWDGGLTSYAGGPTLDQVIADKIGGATIFKSVELGISKRLSVMDGGSTMHNLSHRGPNEPKPPEFNPQKVWQDKFGSFTPKDDPTKLLRTSVLDAVKEQSNRLRQRLGTVDRTRLDAHLHGVSELEKKIQAIPPLCNKPTMPTETNTDINGEEPFDSVTAAMHDLVCYLFSCDLTRVASVMVDGGAAETVYSNLGQNDVHHMNTHTWPGAQNQIHQVVLYHMQRFQQLLEKMYNTADGTGNLLDSSIVFCSSDCSEGWTHSVNNQPMLIAGKGGGSLVHPGIHVKSTTGENPTNVLLTILQAFDPTATSVGSGTCASTTPNTAIKAPA
jgi:hypothetical protein